jgi:hypothetical protein
MRLSEYIRSQNETRIVFEENALSTSNGILPSAKEVYHSR